MSIQAKGKGGEQTEERDQGPVAGLGGLLPRVI